MADALIDRALQRLPTSGRNEAGFWLACRLRDNGFSEAQAESVMRQYADHVRAKGDHDYTDAEISASLSSAWKHPKGRPWHLPEAAGDSRRREVLEPRSPLPREQQFDRKKHDQMRQRIRGCVRLDGTPGEDYLASRGIPVDLARAAHVRYHRAWCIPPKKDGENPLFVPAVVFPLYDLRGKLVGAHGRGLNDSVKHKVTYGNRGLGVFWTPGAQHGAPIILVEGPFDALSLAAIGYPAAARLATDYPHWLSRWTAGRLVYVGWDCDTAGEGNTKKVAQACALFGGKCVRLRPPTGKDFNEALHAMGADTLGDWLQDVLGVYCVHCGATVEHFSLDGIPYCYACHPDPKPRLWHCCPGCGDEAEEGAALCARCAAA